MEAATHLLNQSPSQVALLAIAPVAGVRVDGSIVEVENIARHFVRAASSRPWRSWPISPARSSNRLQQAAFGMSARQSVWRLAVAAIGGLISLSALSQLYAPVAHIALDNLALWARGKLQWLLQVGPDR